MSFQYKKGRQSLTHISVAQRHMRYTFWLSVHSWRETMSVQEEYDRVHKHGRAHSPWG